MPAAVLGSAPAVDAALLEVYDRSLVVDLPAVGLRAPTAADTGRSTYLVGYPAAGPLTVSMGGVVTRVWADQIETDTASQGGNSGGPMFDACGDVLGVLWASNRDDSYSHAAGVVQRALERLDRRWPVLPTDLPRNLRLPPDWLIWHWGPEPPAGVDCSAVDGEFFVGYVGSDRPDAWTSLSAEEGATVFHCAYGQPGVAAVAAPRAAGPNWVPEICVEGGLNNPSVFGRLGLARTVLHDSQELWGEVRLSELEVTTECPHRYTHQVRVRLTGHERGLWPHERRETPAGVVNDSHYWELSLVDQGGRRLEHEYRGFVNWADESWSWNVIEFEAPGDFEPAWIEAWADLPAWPYERRFRVRIEPPEAPVPAFPVQARIAARVESESGRLRFCLVTGEGQRLCPETNSLTIERARPDRWYPTSTVEWRAPLERSELPPDSLPSLVSAGCALTEDLGRLAWQVETITDAGTAFYIGRGQFLTDSELLPEDAPWAVVAQGELALPVVRVAADRRNGLALLELLDRADEAKLGAPVRWAAAADLVDGATRAVVGYPDGDPRRFTLALGAVSEVSERSFQFPTWAGAGAHRVGAPIIDPCSGELVGLSLTWGLFRETSLRAGAAARSIGELRAARTPPPSPVATGPALFGTSALWPRPVYVGSEQPHLGGLVCNVRPSERYDHRYAVYLVSDLDHDRLAVRDGAPLDWDAWSSCSDGKVMVVAYRSDQVPDAVCVEPSRPESRAESREVDWAAPRGVRLLQFSDFIRERCPGIEPEDGGGLPGWQSDLYLRLHIGTDLDQDDLVIEFRDAAGETIEHARWRDWSGASADPDELAWRVDLLTEAEPAMILVTLKTEPDNQP